MAGFYWLVVCVFDKNQPPRKLNPNYRHFLFKKRGKKFKFTFYFPPAVCLPDCLPLVKIKQQQAKYDTTFNKKVVVRTPGGGGVVVRVAAAYITTS